MIPKGIRCKQSLINEKFRGNYHEIPQDLHQELVLFSERRKVGRKDFRGYSHTGLYHDWQNLKLYGILQVQCMGMRKN